MKSLSRRRLYKTLFLLAAAFGARPAARADAPGVLAELPVDPRGELILVPVKYQGVERQFMLDTGSSLNIFDPALSSAAPLGMVPVRPPAGPAVEKALYPALPAAVGGLDLRSAGPILYNDFSDLRAVSDRPVWGIIGMTFLSRYILQLDLDAGKVRFLDPTQAPRAEWGAAVPLRISRRGVPSARARIPGLGPIDFTLDTGDNSGGNIRGALFRRLFPRPSGAWTENLMFTGVEASPSGRVPELAVGGLVFHGVVFEAAEINSLGMAFLRRGVFNFDFPRRTLYIKAGRRIDVAEEADMSGLHLLRRDGRILAALVDPGSPAASAGMVGGDVIVDVADAPEARDDIPVLRRLLKSGDGKTIKLTVLHEGIARPVELRLRKLL